MFVPLRTLIFAGLSAALGLGAGSGCQMLETRDTPPAWKSQVHEELADALNAVHWQPRVEWSPTREWENRENHRPSADALRWRYASDTWRNTLADWETRLNTRSEPSPIVLDEENLLAELAQEDDLPGWNAAILLAQLNPQHARLFEAVLKQLVTKPPSYLVPDDESPTKMRSQRISRTMQSAAAEAWCLVLLTPGEDPVETLAPAGRALLEFHLTEDVRGELFRGIARWVAPADVPGLTQALPGANGQSSNSPRLRQAAMEACVLHALWNREALASSSENETADGNPWPSTLLDWQWEPDAYFESDPLMRRQFAYWLVLTGHPNAGKMLESHLTDADFTVRDNALVHLGWLKTPEALATLRGQSQRPEPRVRAMAVKGLAHWGEPYLARFLEDASPEVRLSVAEELGRFPTPATALHLQKLQADASRDVETAALESTRHWPDHLAIPVLLHGMEHASVQTRRECFRELRRRTRLKDTFPITAGPEIRREAIQQLARDWKFPAHLELSRGSNAPDAKVNRLRVEELRRYLQDVLDPEFPGNSARHQFALKALKESSPEDVPAIETFLLELPDSSRGEVLLHKVLPALSPVYAALLQLQSPDVQERRRAAGTLRTLAERQSLSFLAVRTLRNFLKTEADGLVWRFAITAILPDDNPETALLAARAANHPDSGIRHLACEFALRHKRPAFADWLLPLIHDSQKTVRLAAIEAAGECGNRLVIEGIPGPDADSNLPGLRPLLSDPDFRVALAAAIAMSRLGDPLGHDELIRLSQHADDRVRLEVIAAMGNSRQTRFGEVLIGIGWTAQNEQIKREVLNSLHQLIPAEKHPPALAKATGTDAKIKAWAEWWEHTQLVP